MGRKANDLESVELRIATTPQVVAYLRRLMQTGLYGKNPTEAAERLVTEKLRDLINNNTLDMKGSRSSTGAQKK